MKESVRKVYSTGSIGSLFSQIPPCSLVNRSFYWCHIMVFMCSSPLPSPKDDTWDCHIDRSLGAVWASRPNGGDGRCGRPAVGRLGLRSAKRLPSAPGPPRGLPRRGRDLPWRSSRVFHWRPRRYWYVWSIYRGDSRGVMF